MRNISEELIRRFHAINGDDDTASDIINATADDLKRQHVLMLIRVEGCYEMVIGWSC